MKEMLGMKWMKAIRTSVKTGTHLRKATTKGNVHKVIIEKGKVRIGFHRNARALAKKGA